MTSKRSVVKGMMTITEVADYLHLAINTVRRWSDEGVLTAYRLGPRGDRRYDLQEVNKILKRKAGHGRSD